jgi:hypothetical protein
MFPIAHTYTVAKYGGHVDWKWLYFSEHHFNFKGKYSIIVHRKGVL